MREILTAISIRNETPARILEEKARLAREAREAKIRTEAYWERVRLETLARMETP